MIFYMLDDIKKKLSKQLYGVFAIALLSGVTLVLGGVLVFNVIQKDGVPINKESGESQFFAREDSTETDILSEEDNKSEEEIVYENLPDVPKFLEGIESDAIEKALENFDTEKLNELLEQTDEFEFYSVIDDKRP